MDAENLQLARRPHRVVCSWLGPECLRPFLQRAAPGLFSVLKPFTDAALLEAHGEEFLELLINKAPDADWTAWLQVSMEVAARADNANVFRRLFALCRNDPEFWAVDHRIERVVHRSVARGSAEVLSALLEVDMLLSGMERKYRASFYDCAPALVHAARDGHRSCVALLIKAGSPPERNILTGESLVHALGAAVSRGHEGTVLDLLAAGADVNSSLHPDNLPNPLYTAVRENNESMVNILLAAGADFEKKWMDTMPVRFAATIGRCGPLKRLLEAGADANAVNSRGQSALHMACSNNHEGAVELLLRHNVSVTSRCDAGLSPFDVVATGILNTREFPNFSPRDRARLPCTLNVEETAAADRIHGMLQAASAWGRRGWLVMMRARRLAAGRHLDDSSLENPSAPEQGPHGSNATCRTVETTDGGVCVGVEGLALAGVPSTGASGGCKSHENGGVCTQGLSPGGDHKSGKQAARGDVWEPAVEWLLQCPDDRGVFREILGFL